MLYAGRPEKSFIREDSNVLLESQKKKIAFVHMDGVSSVKEVTGCVVYLIADKIDLALLLALGKGRFDAASHHFRPLLVPPPHSL